MKFVRDELALSERIAWNSLRCYPERGASGWNQLPSDLREELKQYIYDIIGAMHEVYRQLDNGLPEYIYQEALCKQLIKIGYKDTQKEYQHHPEFNGEKLKSYVKMDLMVPKSRGNVIIECKSISELTEKERYQTNGYLTATRFPIAILVNFGTFPKAQIERYYAKDGKIYAFWPKGIFKIFIFCNWTVLMDFPSCSSGVRTTDDDLT